MNSDVLQELLALIKANDGINDKARLARIVFDAFGLTKDRSVYCCADFAIRFSESKTKGKSKSNTVTSLSRLQKYDDRPFVSCVVATLVELREQLAFLRESIHQLRTDMHLITGRPREVEPRRSVLRITSLPKDPTGPDFLQRINAVPTEQLDALRQQLAHSRPEH